MKNLKKIFVIMFFLFFVNGCNTNIYVNHTLTPKLNINPAPKDTVYKTDTLVIK
jgi:PBP1b-binding outer membrane lipoprotein LpoB